MSAKGKVPIFTYVDVTTKGCDGWLNLFFGDHIIALIDNATVADEMRTVIDKRPLSSNAKVTSRYVKERHQ